MNQDLFRMTIDLNVLDHLGINLYSNIAAVLTEVVANTWDADAENVTITIDERSKQISILDDGIGMTVEDINQKFLRVGYRRRDYDSNNGNHTLRGRPVMGRKGLGKLSLFSIAEIIEVRSIKDGQCYGFCMSTNQIREAIETGQQTYSPEPLDCNEVGFTRGTQITLKEVKRQRLSPGITALRKRLARRFTVIGDANDFRITINNELIAREDREELANLQFLWTFGDTDLDEQSMPNLDMQKNLSNRIGEWPQKWNIRGWIATVHKPKQLDRSDIGSLNGIVIFSRGRLFHENILDKVNDGRLYTKYLTGQIEADFLDDNHQPDIATSDRQRIQEDDPRFTEILNFLKNRLQEVEVYWTKWRGDHSLKEIQDRVPALVEWFESFNEGLREQAEKLMVRLGTLPLDDENDRKILYKHGILAFERMKLRGSTETLVENLSNTGKLLKILADRDVLEASYYRDIVKSRLDVIEVFQNLIDENVKEQRIQKYLFNNLWLLDPAWEAVTSSTRMESRLTQAKVIIDDPDEKNALARVDIAYRTIAGRHIIVELKRAHRKVKLLELLQQGQTYVDKLKRILLEEGEISPDIEVVFVLGKPLDEEKDNPGRLKASMEAVSPGSRVVHYQSLIKGAKNAYSEYLEKMEQLDKIQAIIDQL